MSQITYNGIVLPYSYTTKFAQDASYDEIGHTDFCYTKFDIQTQTVINSDYLTLLDPNGNLPAGTTNPAAIMAGIRKLLLQPRKKLSVTFNGVELIPQNGLPGTVDARNGPMPQTCTITQMSNTTFLVIYHVVAHYWETLPQELTPSSGGGVGQNVGGNPILYNRWTDTVDIDACQYTKRTREGKFVIRTDNNQGLIADKFRNQFAVCAPFQGFLRQSSHYTVSPDGLGIQYSLVDQEVFRLPFSPAYEAEGEFTETLTKGGGVRYCECRVALRSSKGYPQSKLMFVAMAAAAEKLAINGAPLFGPEAGVLMAGTRTAKMFDNHVEVRYRVQAPAQTTPDGTGRTLGAAGFDPRSIIRNTPPPINPGAGGPLGPGGNAPTAPGPLVLGGLDPAVPWQPTYLDGGTANVLLQAAAYFDPSVAGTKLNRATGQMSAGLQPGQAGTVKE